MKSNKALKRLGKIEALISDVSERYSSGASHIREALQDAMAAFARVKAAVSSQASSGTAKHPPGKPKKSAVIATVAAPAKRKRTFSAAQRKQQAERMKAYWAAKKKSAKPQPKAKKAASVA